MKQKHLWSCVKLTFGIGSKSHHHHFRYVLLANLSIFELLIQVEELQIMVYNVGNVGQNGGRADRPRRSPKNIWLHSVHRYNNPRTGKRGPAPDAGDERPNPFSQKPFNRLVRKIFETHGYSWFRHLCIRQSMYLQIMECISDINITFENE